MQEPCQKPHCFGNEILPNVSHYHCEENEKQWQCFDWIAQIEGSEYAEQLPLF